MKENFKENNQALVCVSVESSWVDQHFEGIIAAFALVLSGIVGMVTLFSRRFRKVDVMEVKVEELASDFSDFTNSFHEFVNEEKADHKTIDTKVNLIAERLSRIEAIAEERARYENIGNKGS